MIMKRETPKKFAGSTPGGGVLQHEQGQGRGRGRAARRTRAEMKTSCFRMKFLNYDVFFGLAVTSQRVATIAIVTIICAHRWALN